MKDFTFEVNFPVYKSLLTNAMHMGIAAAAEQAASDSNRYVKYDSGDLHHSQDVDIVQHGMGWDGEISWNMPYAQRQYFTGTPINHAKGDGPPHLKWAHYAHSLHHEDWEKQFVKGCKEAFS